MLISYTCEADFPHTAREAENPVLHAEKMPLIHTEVPEELRYYISTSEGFPLIYLPTSSPIFFVL